MTPNTIRRVSTTSDWTAYSLAKLLLREIQRPPGCKRFQLQETVCEALNLHLYFPVWRQATSARAESQATSLMRSTTQVVIAVFQVIEEPASATTAAVAPAAAAPQPSSSRGSFVAATFEPPSLSRCSCETGKALCSHLIAFLIIIKQIQGKHCSLPFE